MINLILMGSFTGWDRLDAWFMSSGSGNALELIPTLSIVMPWVACFFIVYELSGRGRGLSWRTSYTDDDDFVVPDEVCT